MVGLLAQTDRRCMDVRTLSYTSHVVPSNHPLFKVHFIEEFRTSCPHPELFFFRGFPGILSLHESKIIEGWDTERTGPRCASTSWGCCSHRSSASRVPFLPWSSLARALQRWTSPTLIVPHSLRRLIHCTCAAGAAKMREVCVGTAFF